MFEEDARDALIRYLGYSVKQPQTPLGETPETPEVSAEEASPVVEPVITAEDLFSVPSLPVTQQSSVLVADETPVGNTREIDENTEWCDELKQSIIIGDFVSAVSTCFKYHRYADALVIAGWGGAELAEQTTVD